MQTIENDPHLQVMAERNRAHDQVIKLRVILGNFEEYLKCSIQITEKSFESQCEFFNKGHGGRERCIEEQAKLQAYKECLQALEQIEESTR